jgi:serine/threonine-protein kinase
MLTKGMPGDTLTPDGMAGTVLGEKYRLLRVIGSGAMGHVYQAEHIGLGRSVAVKLLRTAQLSNPQSLDRFRHEALAASRINHPNAIAIFDFGVTPDGLPYLVMELLRGRTLASIIAEQPLVAARAVRVGAQVLSAIEEAHGCGVIHRDLKTENVIVETLRDGTDFVKVLDFGIARFADQPEDGVAAGTPEYMAPEQIRGVDVSFAADIYAVGIMIFEMIVGHTPFAGGTIPVVLDRHLFEAPVAPRQIVPTCPEALNAVVMKALEKESNRRFANAQDMREALLASLGGAQATRTCPSCHERMPREARTCPACGADVTGVGARPLPLQVAGSGGMAFSASLGTGTQQPAPSAATQQPAPAPVQAPSRATRLTSDISRSNEVLLGREDEVRRVTRFLQSGGESASMAVVGPPGVGKARLVLHAARIVSPNVITFIAGPDPTGCRVPWYPILSMIQSILGITSVSSYEMLQQSVARSGLPDRDAPGLAELFALPGPLARLAPSARRRETITAALRALRAVQNRYPKAALCFVDIDRYDKPSLQLLTTLSDSLPAELRLIMTTAQAAAVPPSTTKFELGGLAPAAARSLLTALLGSPAESLPSPEAIHAITEGAPAALEQLAGWLASGNDISSAPSRLVDLVAARLSRLPTAVRRVLQVIATHGQVVPKARVTRTLAEVDKDGVSLSALLKTGLVAEDAHDYSIPFELVATVAVACTPADVRRELAREAIAALGKGQTSAPAGLVGQYAEAAEELGRAAEEYTHAGEDAAHRFDEAGAASWFWRAITVSRRMQAQDDPSGSRAFIEASVRLADVLRAQGELGLAAGVLDEADFSQPDVGQQAAILRARGKNALAAGDPRLAQRHLHRAIGLGFRLGDPAFLCETYIDLAGALSQLGNPSLAITELQEGVDALTLGEGLGSLHGPEQLWLLGQRLAELHQRIGDLRSSESAARAALAHATNHGAAMGEGQLHMLLAGIFDAAGNSQKAMVHRANALDLMRRLGDRRSTAEILIACARATGGTDAPIPSSIGSTARKALQIAHDLAVEIGWDEGIQTTRTSVS